MVLASEYMYMCVKIIFIVFHYCMTTLFFDAEPYADHPLTRLLPPSNRACVVPCSVDCELGDWGHWSACSQSCGEGGQQIRCVEPHTLTTPVERSWERRTCFNFETLTGAKRSYRKRRTEV